MDSNTSDLLVALIDEGCTRGERLLPEFTDHEDARTRWEYIWLILEEEGDSFAMTEVVVGNMTGRKVRRPLPVDGRLRELSGAFVTGMSRAPEFVPGTDVHVIFRRYPKVEVDVLFRSRDPEDREFVRGKITCNGSTAPNVVVRLFERWSPVSEEEKRAQVRMRAQSMRYPDLMKHLDRARTDLPRFRSDIARRFRLHLEIIELSYLRGDDLGDIEELLEEWHQDALLAFRSLESDSGRSKFFGRTDGDAIVRSAVDLFVVAMAFGRVDIVRDLLGHTVLSQATYRPLDALAISLGIEQESDLEAMRTPAWDDGPVHRLWLMVMASTPGRRQGAIEKFMPKWQERPRSRHTISTWNWPAAMLVLLFDLDDDTLRASPGYPFDVVEFARRKGAPPVDPTIRVPGPWTRPRPRTVIEPEVAREPLVLGGDEMAVGDLSALLSPIGDEPVSGSETESFLETAVEVGTVVLVDWKGMDGTELAEFLQYACMVSGLPAPEWIPARIPRTPEKAFAKLDAWLTKVGIRLIRIDDGSDDYLIAPVLASDHEQLAGRECAGVGLLAVDGS